MELYSVIKLKSLFILVFVILFSCEGKKDSGDKAAQNISEESNETVENMENHCLYDNYEWQRELLEKGNKSVKDYFLLLPIDIVYCEQPLEDESYKSREDLLTKENIKAGYLEAGNMQVALFKDRENDLDLIAIQRGKSGAGTTCGGINAILEFKEGCWVYRNDLLPEDKVLTDIEKAYLVKNNYEVALPYFALPEVGTTIRVLDEENEGEIYNLKWNGTVFEAVEIER